MSFSCELAHTCDLSRRCAPQQFNQTRQAARYVTRSGINRDPDEAFLDIVVEMEDATAALLIASTYGVNFIQWMENQNRNGHGGNSVRAILSGGPRLATKRAGSMPMWRAALFGVGLGLVTVFSPGIAGWLVSGIRHRVQVAPAT